jgi:hypothetical protein
MSPLHLLWIVPLAFVVGGLLGVLVMSLCFIAGEDERQKGR